MGVPPPPRERRQPSGQIIVCDQPIPVDWTVFNFRDHPSFDAAQPRCFLDKDRHPTDRVMPFDPARGLGRSPERFGARSVMRGGKELGRLQRVIRQVVLHHDGLFCASDCFHVLHDERGLSAHFIIDNDGTIYQTLDLLHLAYHATGVNPVSIGIELCNRGDYHEREASQYAGQRATQDVQIHGSSHRMWQFTDAQYDALAALGQTLHRLFPDLPPVYPGDSGGLIQTAIREVREFSGYLGHYHVTVDKWDPGCLDFARVCQRVRGRTTWFVMPRGTTLELAESEEILAQQSHLLLQNNAEEAMGGYFPVGPCGRELVWHGGVHFRLPRGTPLYSPLTGRIVAARKGPPSPIGSCDFVLAEYRLPRLGERPLRFFMLLFHVEFDPLPLWLEQVRLRGQSLPHGQVALPDVPMRAGDVLARAGEAGPPGEFEGQVHVEIFAPEDLSVVFPPDTFLSVTDKDSTGLCSERDVLEPLVRGGYQGQSGTARALQTVLRHPPTRDELSRLSARYRSEWILDGTSEARLRRGPLGVLPNANAVWRDQVRPTLWWTSEITQKLGLPADGMVWHYHPVSFLVALHRLTERPIGSLAQPNYQSGGLVASDGATGDNGYLDEEDRMLRQPTDVSLEELAEGWPDPVGR